MQLSSEAVSTTPYSDQTPGTSGLRKKVAVFRQHNYTENFIQAILNAMDDATGTTLVIGGDGRYFMTEAIQIIMKIAAGNGVSRLIIGQNGILSTPAVSNLIRRRKCDGGIILTASHNPGGPNQDFGIKFNVKNGGPAPQPVTDAIKRHTLRMDQYSICHGIMCSLDTVDTHYWKVDDEDFVIEVIDSVDEYVQLMKDIFDFDRIRELFSGEGETPPFKIRIDCMHGVTGPYAERIFQTELHAPVGSVVNHVPLPDFGGKHPDPNLVYGIDLVDAMMVGDTDFGAAFDGDGDRNMILGKDGFFVTPSDSLAVIADNLKHIPYFRLVGVKGFARSMPTAAAVDLIAEKQGVLIHEVPTGWKFFGNLMDANMLSLCGEESFGTGSNHIREKDGIWAALAWLQIIACTKKSVRELVESHWEENGRNFFARYDYENVEIERAQNMMTHIQEQINSRDFVGKTFTVDDQEFTVKFADDYSYLDPIDKTLTENQGFRVIFEDDSRIVYRLSGTGSTGATVRIYFEMYETQGDTIFQSAQVILDPLIQVGKTIANLQAILRRSEPNVIT